MPNRPRCSQATVFPLEVVQTRLAVSPVGTYSGALHRAATCPAHLRLLRTLQT
jgi:hypothetical protein